MSNHRPDHRSVKAAVARFPPRRVSGSGVDPMGSYWEFMKKDVTRNIDIHRDTVKRQDDLEARKACSAVGTTTATRGLPVARSVTPTERQPLATDHISFRPVQIRRDRVQSTTPGFSKAVESKEGWSPLVQKSTASNRLSTPYNPITFEPITYAQSTHVVDAKRQKGVTEFSDLQNPYADRPNQVYRQALTQDPSVFRRKTGIFSHMYDAAAAQGYISKPFDGKRENDGKAPFK